MRADFSLQALATGILVAFVGFGSSFAVILQGLTAAGATQAQAASGLMALSIAMGVCAIIVSLWTRLPISIAWSTPGAALLATSNLTIGFNAAVGAFLATGALIVAAGLFRPLGRWVAAIPAALANAMLAGVLLGLCLAPVRAVAQAPALGLAVFVTWAVVARWRRLFAVPAAVLVAFALIWLTAPAGVELGSLWPHAEFVMPAFSPSALISVAVPLFIVTMASQNIPGMAVLHLNGVRPNAGKLFEITGVFTMLAAPFGGHAVNLAAITAALCAGPDAHPDPRRRYWAAAVAGAGYILLGLLAGAATAAVRAAPPVLIEAVAGLALLGAFAGALLGAVQAPEDREAAVITFLVAASGLTLFGIGGAFWGLIAGGAVRALARAKFA
jgi:benzoate membrane transport protein